MRQFLKRLLVVVILTVVTQSSFVSAAGIRVIGPSGRIQDAPEYKLPISQQPSKFYGPTKGNETLWSIASKLRPSGQVTVQQTLLAIFELNPGAFENQNIHSLIPGSTIRIPSPAQVRSVTTEQAVAVMKTHQARLDREAGNRGTVAKSEPAPKPKTVVGQPKPDAALKSKPEVSGTTAAIPSGVKETEKNTTNSLQSKLAEMAKPDVSTSEDQSDLLALEEKNHHLMLMLSKVQSEVEHLKSNLDDETRIRTEVEKLLSEEKRKSQEAAKLAPTSLDKLLSEWWFILALGLIPGALIAYLIISFIRKRGEKDDTTAESVAEAEQPEAVNIGEMSSEGVDDLMLDDDLFAADDDKDEEDVNSDDVFAELEDSDLSISLEDEDGDDPFAAVDEDGDFIGMDIDDTLSGESANGISVNADDKAVGLEEMEKALDEVANDLDDDFDLSNSEEPKENEDDSIISQDDIESLLSGVEDLDSLEDESELDIPEEEGELSGLGVGNAAIASDSDLEDLFGNIESQADLDDIEDNALSEEDYNLDSDEDSEDSLINDDATLLDELVEAEEDNEEETDWDKELDELSSQFDLSSDDDDFDEDLLNSAATLDELLEESDSSETLPDDGIEKDEELNKVVDPELSSDPIDDGTEFLDELIEIEKNAQEAEPEVEAIGDEESEDFNSDDFLDDLLDSVPENDPLLDDMDLDGSALDDDFDFNPEIEGHDIDVDEASVTEEVAEPKSVQGNEFGIPQDEDWDVEDELSEESDDSEEFQPEVVEELLAEEPELVEEPDEPAITNVVPEPAEEADVPEALADEELPEFTEEEVLAGSEGNEPELSAPDEPLLDEESASDDELTAEPEMAEVVPGPVEEADVPEALADEELPEFTEEDVLAGAEVSEPELSAPDESLLDEESASGDELTAEPAMAGLAPEPAEKADVPEALGDEELPEFTEEEVLAGSESSEPELSAPDESLLDEESAPDDELTAEPAMTGLAPEPVEEAGIPEALGDEELPEFTEEDVLTGAESGEPELSVPEDDESMLDEEIALDDELTAEPEMAGLAPESAEEADVPEALADEELPEFTEEDVLAGSEGSEPELSAPEDDESQLDEEIALDDELTAESEMAEVVPEPAEEADVPEALADEDLSEFTEEDVLAGSEVSEPELSAPEDDESMLDEEITLDDELTAEPEMAGFASEAVEEADVPEALADAELPEFTEEDVLAGAESGEPELSAPEDDESILDEEITPDDELTAEPEMAGLAPEPVEEAGIPEALADEELPEFTEEDLLAGAESGEPELSAPEDDESMLDEEITLDDELTAESEMAEVVQEPAEEADVPKALADEELPEFTEEDVLAGSESGEPELSAPEDDESMLDEEITPDDELTTESEIAGLAPEPVEDADAPEALADEELPEFTAEDALDSYDSETEEYAPEVITPESGANERLELDDDELPDFDEYELLEQAVGDAAETDKEVSRAVFDEKALDELLSEEDASEHYALSSSMDDDFIDSGGMNIETMLEGLDGEDWNGFKLSPEQQDDIASDIPDDEQNIWREEIQTAEPELENENWAIQDNLVDDDPNEKSYMSIDELMAQVDAEGGEFEEQDLKLDVGLNEFPDVIGNISDIDVDSNAEASGKLDLAKIYMEMNDEQGAIKLLEEAIVDGDDGIRRQAKTLIDQINGSDE